MGKQVAAGIPLKKAGEQKSLQNRTGIWRDKDVRPRRTAFALSSKVPR